MKAVVVVSKMPVHATGNAARNSNTLNLPKPVKADMLNRDRNETFES